MHDIQLLHKGLSFSPTPRTPHDDAHKQTLTSFNEFAKSLRLKYKRAQYPNQKQHHHTPKPTETSHLYRRMKFLPAPTIESPQQRYTGIAHLERYIDDTKQQIADNLPNICANDTTPNLPNQQRLALDKLKKARQTITIKPADKNLGIVLLDTDDYITQCMAHLTDTTTYRQATQYPATEISNKITHTVTAFKPQLETFNKRLYTHLHNGHRHPRTPQFYGIPKIHKKYTHLPPMRPIVSQTLSILSPTACFLDHVLQPLAQSYTDYLHNSTALSLTLQDLHVPDNAILVTIDVTGLYPSIPQSQCLDTIYNEMHNRSHLVTFDPNLIIHLLHTNINYNYFSFAGHIFQQIKGTAMGAAFSPTIANIFMSTIIREFLHTQNKRPLTLARYIDDIFMIWTDTEQELTTFLTELNAFHPNLHFTHQHSLETIDFLDLTIYKDTHFDITNILDTKTFQKPLNLYQYLHFTSAHPSKVFKAIIRGECIRYARTNTTHETYTATVHIFKQRLRRRGYPDKLIDKTKNTVKYCNRRKYLTHSLPTQPTCSPPVHKCLPPPHYKSLKQIILQNYAQLKFISPRFIALRHPTLQNTLVRANLIPTDEQFIDITVSLNATAPTEHTESATLPHIRAATTTITPCRQPRCTTCRYHLRCTSTFRSTFTPFYMVYVGRVYMLI